MSKDMNEIDKVLFEGSLLKDRKEVSRLYKKKWKLRFLKLFHDRLEYGKWNSYGRFVLRKGSPMYLNHTLMVEVQKQDDFSGGKKPRMIKIKVQPKPGPKGKWIDFVLLDYPTDKKKKGTKLLEQLETVKVYQLKKYQSGGVCPPEEEKSGFSNEEPATDEKSLTKDSDEVERKLDEKESNSIEIVKDGSFDGSFDGRSASQPPPVFVSIPHIALSNLKVRAGPRIDAEYIGNISKADEVEVLDELMDEGGISWLKIKLKSHDNAWIMSRNKARPLVERKDGLPLTQSLSIDDPSTTVLSNSETSTEMQNLKTDVTSSKHQLTDIGNSNQEQNTANDTSPNVNKSAKSVENELNKEDNEEEEDEEDDDPRKVKKRSSSLNGSFALFVKQAEDQTMVDLNEHPLGGDLSDVEDLRPSVSTERSKTPVQPPPRLTNPSPKTRRSSKNPIVKTAGTALKNKGSTTEVRSLSKSNSGRGLIRRKSSGSSGYGGGATTKATIRSRQEAYDEHEVLPKMKAGSPRNKSNATTTRPLVAKQSSGKSSKPGTPSNKTATRNSKSIERSSIGGSSSKSRGKSLDRHTSKGRALPGESELLHTNVVSKKTKSEERKYAPPPSKYSPKAKSPKKSLAKTNSPNTKKMSSSYGDQGEVSTSRVASPKTLKNNGPSPLKK